MRKSILAACAISCALLSASALARRVEISVEGRGRMLIVDASINQRVSGRFIVDTGASYCVISKEMARDVSLSGRNDGEKVPMQTANGIVMATIGQARRIDVGDAVARDVAVAVVDDAPVPGFEGLLGLSFLEKFKYSVDSDRKVLTLQN